MFTLKSCEEDLTWESDTGQQLGCCTHFESWHPICPSSMARSNLGNHTLLLFHLGVTPSSVQDLLLTAWITLATAGEPYGVPGTEPEFVACEASTLPPVFSFRLQVFLV